MSWLLAFYAFLFSGVPKVCRVLTALQPDLFRFQIARTTFRYLPGGGGGVVVQGV
jgi:hypothetical protein